MQNRIPFVPFELKKAKKYSEKFRGIANILVEHFPNLEIDLIQGHIAIPPGDYVAITLFSTSFWFVVTTALMLLLVVMLGAGILANLSLIFMVSVSITVLAFFYLFSYPAVQARHRMRFLERDLLFALRHALIEVKSGVTLFDAMASIARGGYGIVSEEFDKVVKDINIGASAEEALEKIAFENPSLPLRQVIWQISNALKAGSDIGITLEELVSTFENEQLFIIRKYGREMNPWTMMYMMCAVILPSLGITFTIVMSAFVGFAVGNTIFYLLLIFAVFFQVFFISFIKSKKPMVGT